MEPLIKWKETIASDFTSIHKLNGLRVRAYWNFHTKEFSIVLMESKKNLRKRFLNEKLRRRVVATAQHVVIQNAKFVVNKGGRDRVLRTGHKNVHAYVDGILDTTGIWTVQRENKASKVAYDPYFSDSFYIVETKEPVLRSTELELYADYDKPYIFAEL